MKIPGQGGLRVGIGTRVYGAVGGILALTIAASTLAALSFSRVGDTMRGLVDERFPVVETSLELAQLATTASAVASQLAGAADDKAREAAVARLAEGDKRMRQLIEDLAARHAIDPATFVRPIDLLHDKVRQTDEATRSRIAISRERLSRAADLAKARDAFNQIVMPTVDEAQFNLVLGLETATEAQEPDRIKATLKALSEQELALYGASLSLVAEVNEIYGLLREVIVLNNRELLVPARERYQALAARIGKGLGAVEKTGANAKRSAATEAVVAFGNGKDSLFTLRE